VAEIEGLAGWHGSSGVLLEAMLRVGLLEKDSKDIIRVHDWKTTNGHLIAFKVRASKAAIIRWSNARSNAKAILKQSPYQPTIPTIPTIPTVPNQVAETTAAAASLPVNGDGRDFDAFLLQQWGREGRVGFALMEGFRLMAKTHGWDRVRYAVSEAAKHGARNSAYVKAVLEPKDNKKKFDEEFDRLVKAKGNK
jgi:hypothetical protein